MTTGLEFFRSWRFWVFFVGSTSLVMLASTGVQIAVVSYLRAPDIEPDPFFSLLGGLAVLFLSVAVFWFAYVRNNGEPHYPKEHEELLSLIIMVVAMLVTVAEWSAVHFLFINWTAPDAPDDGGFSVFLVWAFALGSGPYIAMVEWDAMRGANSDPNRATTSDSP
jgi:hypothetical protein